MEQRRLGGSGLVVSVVGLGCNNLSRPGTATETLDGTRAVVDACFDTGITFFDVADAYGSPRGRAEELLGAALGNRRDQVVLATKFGAEMTASGGPDTTSRASRRYVRLAVEASLRRLGTDWIDLYQLHRPDPRTPIEETLSVLDDLVHAGKVRYVGHCNLAAWEIVDADWTARSRGLTRPISASDHYSLLQRDVEREIVPACDRFGLGFLPYFPLASGLLTGKYRRGHPPPPNTRLASRQRMLDTAPWDRIESLGSFAAQRGVGMLEVSVGGLAAQPTVSSVLCGATSPDQVRANAAAAGWRPTDDDLAVLDRICPPGQG